MDKEVILRSDQVDILCGLINQEIRHLADLRLEFRSKDIDCDGISTRIDNLFAILKVVAR